MNQSESLRVLHVIERIEKNNGVTAVVLNYFRHINKEKVIFDFITHGDSEQDLVKEILDLGGRIYHFPELSFRNLKTCSQKAEMLFRRRGYQIVHCHIPNAAFIYLKAARNQGVPIRIIHSHNSKGAETTIKKLRNDILHKIGKHYANQKMACSKMAADYLFGTSRKVFLLNNAIDLEKYKFRNEDRQMIRNKLHLDEKIVLGHVGRFSLQKNHVFLLEILERLLRKNKNYRLLLVGNGELEKSIKSIAKQKKIQDYIIFAGVQKEVSKYLCAMDFFLLPSLFEGLPVVGVEAQAVGLPCFMSDKITREVEITGQVRFLNLDEEIWVEAIENHKKQNRDQMVEKIINNFTAAGYCIQTEAERLVEYYFKLTNSDIYRMMRL